MTEFSTEIRLVRGGWVAAQDKSGKTDVLRDSAVAIADQKIVELGPFEALRHTYPEADCIGSAESFVLPGIVNGHSHSNGVPLTLRGVADDVLETWLLSHAAARSQDPYLATAYSALSQLRHGVTLTVDLCSVPPDPEQARVTLEARIKAYDDVGMRAILAPGISVDSHIVHGEGEDEALLRSLPEELATQARQMFMRPREMTLDEYIALVREAIAATRDHPRIDVWFGPPGPQWVGDSWMLRIAEEAERLDVGIQTHVVESLYEKLYGVRAHGSTIAHLDKLGVLSERFSIAHGVWLTEDELAIMERTGAGVIHNASSNLRLRAGIAPIRAMMDASMRVGLGMDGTTIGDDEDPFAEMRLAMRLQRAPQFAEKVVSPREVLALATEGSARVLGRADSLGALAIGAAADLTVLDTARMRSPWIEADVDMLELAVLRAKASDVREVVVNGELVIQDGTPTKLDHEDIGRRLADYLDAHPVSPERHALIAELKPHVERWYGNWQVPELVPYWAMNSRS